MDILGTPAEARAWRRTVPGDVGFVPTMGYLHEGHLALVRRARSENAATAVSIFVNPTQFGPGEDFERYPRDEERDLRLLRECGVDAVYLPAPAVIYPPGFQTYVTVERVTRMLEGAARPGHFRGVATVVLKLLNTIEPRRAYFGRKDAQQLRVIRRMARDLDLACEIVPCDIVRESDGLAMSSRNVYLTPAEREAAPVIRRALLAAMDQFTAGERQAVDLKTAAETIIAGQHLGTTEYISLAADDTLEEIDGLVERDAVLSIVVRFGATRLLDNIELRPKPAGRPTAAAD